VPWTYLQVLSAMAIGFALSLALILMGVSVAGFTVSGGVVVLTLALAATVAIAVPYTILNILAQRRRKRIEQQFPVSLDIFVRALRSGHPVASAIALITEEMEDPIGSEFGLVSDEVSYGVELTDALESMANRWDLEDMRMFVVSLSVQMETGGNLAEILENLSEVIRARASLYLKVRALSSEGRMTAWILSVLPAITFTLMFMVNPGFYLNTAGDPIFIGGFAGLMLLYVIGIFWIKHLVNIKV
jgi:tight adherence protein B